MKETISKRLRRVIERRYFARCRDERRLSHEWSTMFWVGARERDAWERGGRQGERPVDRWPDELPLLKRKNWNWDRARHLMEIADGALAEIEYPIGSCGRVIELGCEEMAVEEAAVDEERRAA